MNKQKANTTSRDMTQGSILMQMVLFAMPLLLGNIFQLFYNTVDTLVVGNFVGTQALAAVGSTTMIVNIMVLFFNGMSIGAGVIISQSYGAKKLELLHRSIETTMTMTFVLGAAFTVIGILMVRPMLIMMATPEDVLPEASLYLRIYFAGIAGLMIYNMGSGILRAVGDSTRPLYFLIFSSILNVILDLSFVLWFRMGIAGVALATIISQFISALLVLFLLTRTKDIYKMTWTDLKMDPDILKKIMQVGLPTAIQSTITAVSNVFVQSYINVFGSAAMAGWSCYNKLDQFVFLPMSSMSGAATTFVSQNIGAGKKERANKGAFSAIGLTMALTAGVALILIVFAADATRWFTKDEAVIAYGVLFIRTNTLFLIFNCINHVLAGALRGWGDSKAPMVCMLLSFVGIRQVYLYIMAHYISNTPKLVGFGYPVGWAVCCFIELGYFFIKYRPWKAIPRK